MSASLALPGFGRRCFTREGRDPPVRRFQLLAIQLQLAQQPLHQKAVHWLERQLSQVLQAFGGQVVAVGVVLGRGCAS